MDIGSCTTKSPASVSECSQEKIIETSATINCDSYQKNWRLKVKKFLEKKEILSAITPKSQAESKSMFSVGVDGVRFIIDSNEQLTRELGERSLESVEQNLVNETILLLSELTIRCNKSGELPIETPSLDRQLGEVDCKRERMDEEILSLLPRLWAKVVDSTSSNSSTPRLRDQLTDHQHNNNSESTGTQKYPLINLTSHDDGGDDASCLDKVNDQLNPLRESMERVLNHSLSLERCFDEAANSFIDRANKRNKRLDEAYQIFCQKFCPESGGEESRNGKLCHQVHSEMEFQRSYCTLKVNSPLDEECKFLDLFHNKCEN